MISENLLAQRPEQFKSIPAGLSVGRLAKLLGVSYNITRALCRRVGYAIHPRWADWQDTRPQNQLRREQIMALPPGLTVTEVAMRMDMSYDIALRWIQQLGYHAAKRPAGIRWKTREVRGRRTGAAGGNEIDRQKAVLGIATDELKKLPAGLTRDEVARRLGISYECACQLSLARAYDFRRKSKVMDAGRIFKELPAGLTLGQVAERFNISYGYSSVLCRQHGYRCMRYSKFAAGEGGRKADHAHMEKIRKLPPGLTVKQVAWRLRISRPAAGVLIRQAKYEFEPAYGRMKVKPEQWRKVNWRERDAAIARKIGVSRARVWQVRTRDAPATRKPRRTPKRAGGGSEGPGRV